MALDPVCGMQVDPAKAAGSFDYQGKTYFFCSPHCVAKFKSDPAKYVLPQQDTQAAKRSPAGGKYTCPMHPEIVQEGPGSCPKCGMALVPMVPAAGAEEENAELRDMTRRFWVSAVLSAPLVVLAMAPYFGFVEPFGLAPKLRAYVEF